MPISNEPGDPSVSYALRKVRELAGCDGLGCVLELNVTNDTLYANHLVAGTAHKLNTDFDRTQLDWEQDALLRIAAGIREVHHKVFR
jgi:hypothetical protein